MVRFVRLYGMLCCACMYVRLRMCVLRARCVRMLSMRVLYVRMSVMFTVCNVCIYVMCVCLMYVFYVC